MDYAVIYSMGGIGLAAIFWGGYNLGKVHATLAAINGRLQRLEHKLYNGENSRNNS